jgi:hypothetical protein
MSDNFDALFEPEDTEPCVECGAAPGADHASWCLATVEPYEDDAEADHG